MNPECKDLVTNIFQCSVLRYDMVAEFLVTKCHDSTLKTGKLHLNCFASLTKYQPTVPSPLLRFISLFHFCVKLLMSSQVNAIDKEIED